ncbi:MAG: imelysin family protein [Flavobacteriaceae bacterium]|nr:imelysin family protein [Flavobacteriaceae bacterium]
MKTKHYFLAIPALVLLVFGCSSDENNNENNNSNFDREAMLAHWADNIIKPAYADFTSKVEALQTATDDFTSTPNTSNLQKLRTTWETAYITWQKVSMFEIGPAEDIQFRGFTNVYPTSTSTIDASITSGNINLGPVSTQDEQGFPAMDYLLYGLGDASDQAIVAFYTTNSKSANYIAYLKAVMDKIKTNTNKVNSLWQGDYRDTFVNNSGASASSSVDRFVNDYIFYYEKALRAGKVGIPAGVFSNAPLSDKVEAIHRSDLSKTLLTSALQATQDFFNGKHYGNNNTGPSLKSYLDYLNTIKGGTDLSALINTQFETSQTAIANLNNNFSQQIQTNNAQMLAAYETLQANVVLLKVDMLQALDINVDYVDADGD